MKYLFIILTTLIFSSCFDDDGTLTTYDYYIKNNLSKSINFVGVTNSDTVFSKVIESEKEILFFKVEEGVSITTYDKTNLLDADSIIISMNDSILYEINNIVMGPDSIIYEEESSFLLETENSESLWIKKKISANLFEFKFTLE